MIAALILAIFNPVLLVFGFTLWDVYWTQSALLLTIFKGGVSSFAFLLILAILRHLPLIPFEPFVGLTLSGFLGITVGDSLWLYSMQNLGSRRMSFYYVLGPMLAGLFSQFYLGESLKVFQCVSVFFVCISILFIMLQKTSADEDSPPTISGHIACFLNVAFDVFGAVLTKEYGSDLNPVLISLIRFGMATVLLLPVLYVQQFEPFERKPTAMVTLGTFSATVAVNIINNYTIFHLDFILYSTLLSTVPIYGLIFTYFLKKEEINFKTIIATIICIGSLVGLTLSSS